MYRKTPLLRKKSLSRNVRRNDPTEGVIRKWNGMVAFLPKKLQELESYAESRDSFLRKIEICQAALPGCQHFASTIHHKKGRGIYLLVEEYFLGCCPNCHGIIELNPLMAVTRGFTLPRIEAISRIQYFKSLASRNIYIVKRIAA